MARLPRINIANIPQHIIQVGHNNLNCFFDDEDYEFYLASLQKAAEQYDVDLHAYVLMPNAIQMVATPNIANGISSMMQSLGRRYVQYVNHRYQRSGTLWGGRYKSSVIDSEAYLLTCYRYVELKPMHEGIVESPEFTSVSFNHHTGRKKSKILEDHRLYLRPAIPTKSVPPSTVSYSAMNSTADCLPILLKPSNSARYSAETGHREN